LEFASSIKKPIIIVQVNYRLGGFGFAVSTDISGESQKEEFGESEYIGNFGLHDQRNAFLWVKDHISDFGGDPANVTGFGVSAGSSCIHQHMLSGSPLFDRAILMSGTAGTLGPLPMDLYQKEWDNLARECGIQNGSSAERLGKLRALDADRLLQLYTSKPLGPYGDSKFLPFTWTLDEETPLSRCNAVILGDVRVEGLILDGVSQETFHDILQDLFPDEKSINSFYSSFGFSSGQHSLRDLPEENYKQGLRLFFSVVIFQFPTLRTAEKFPQYPTWESGSQTRRSYLYHFEETSPWPGPTLGLAYHGQCATYVHLNEVGEEEFPASSARASEDMARAWISFAHGEEPWPAYDPQAGRDKYLRFGPGGETSLQTVLGDAVRPQHYLPWVRENWPVLQGLCRKLLYESRLRF
jgi:carboxylesterase type B